MKIINYYLALLQYLPEGYEHDGGEDGHEEVANDEDVGGNGDG